MNKNLKLGLLIGFLLILLFIINNNRYSKKNNKKTNIYGGDDHTESEEEEINLLQVDGVNTNENNDEPTINCSLEEINKHNSISSKWIYNNGTIYDLSAIINANYVNVDNLDRNIKNTVNYFKFTEEQDLSKILKSIEDYNSQMTLYMNDENKLEIFYIDELKFSNETDEEDDTNTLSIEEQKLKKFNKFKFIFIKSITQFKKGTICPAGLLI